MVDGIARNLQRAAKRREEDAERKHASEQPFLIDAQRRHHVAVLGRGAHQHAPSRALEHQPENAEHDGPEHDQEQVVARDVLAKETDRALEPRRTRADQVARSPSPHHEVFNHQREAEGREQLEQLRRMIDPPQQDHLDDHADDRDDQRRGNDAAPEAERAGEALGQRESDVGTEHIEGAVGEIDDPRHAKNDRQARRDKKQRRRAGKAGQELDDIKGHRRSGCCTCRAGSRASLASARMRSPLSETHPRRERGRKKSITPSGASFRLRRRSGDSRSLSCRRCPP